MTLLNHVGHSYHSISASDILLVVAGVAIAAGVAYAVMTLLRSSKKENNTLTK